MSSSRPPSTGSFRPTRTTRTTSAIPTTTGTTATRLTRPPSQSSGINGRTSSLASTRSATIGTVKDARFALGAGTSVGLKRKTRTASTSAEPDQPTTTKKPALSNAFSAHTTQTALQKQLLAVQAQVAELQNSLLEKQGRVDRLEADLRLVATREEKEREDRKSIEQELSQQIESYEHQLISIKKSYSDLEADNEDLSDAYSQLKHDSESHIAKLRTDLAAQSQQITFLESQRDESETRAKIQEERVRELEELLENLHEDDYEDEDEGEGGISHDEDKVIGVVGRGDPRVEEVVTKLEVDEALSLSEDSKNELEEDELEEEIDADGEVDPVESGPVVDNDNDISMTEESSLNADGQETGHHESSPFRRPISPQIEAYPDPGAPPPYTISSSPSRSASTHSRSQSVDSESISSSGAMSISISHQDVPQVTQHSHNSTPISIRDQSISRIDPLSHIRRRLSYNTPRRKRLSVGSSNSTMSLSRARERDKDKEVIRAELARQTAHLTSLETTNSRLLAEVSRLRIRAEGAEILREEKRELERRAEGVDSLRLQLAEVESEKLALSKQVSELEFKLRNQEQSGQENSFSQTPMSVTRKLAALQKIHAALLDEHGQLKASLHLREIELSEAREAVSETTKKLDRQVTEMAQLREAFVRKEKDCELLDRDVTFLKSLVTSYKDEETTFSVSHDEDGMNTASREKLEQRISQLETLLSEYKETIEVLEKEVTQLQRARGAASGRPQEQWDELEQKIKSLEEELDEANDELNKQDDQVEKLEQQLFELGGEIGAGRHIPPATRVLALRGNPAQEWADSRKEILDGLKRENEGLLERLRELEEQGIITGSVVNEDVQLVPRASLENLRLEIANYKNIIKQKDKRLDRLREIFAAKTDEFKEAITSLLGLKLAFYPNGQVRVTSVYDLSVSFVFQPSKNKNEGAKMQLIAAGEGAGPDVQGIMNTWIVQEESIPCFLASITLECFDMWKLDKRELD